MGTMLAAKRGDPLRVEGVSDPANPDSALSESDAGFDGPGAIIDGPTFAEWVEPRSA
ncbi:MAG: hypothetical protein AB7R89_04240 [Dehalococcoidia bacterium]